MAVAETDLFTLFNYLSKVTQSVGIFMCTEHKDFVASKAGVILLSYVIDKC